MAKKLVTTDHNMVKKVENVLRAKKIPCAWVHLGEKTDEFMLVVLNRHGEALKQASIACSTKTPYHVGVLRGHKEYKVPNGILKELCDCDEKR